MHYLCKQICLFREIKLNGEIVLIPIQIQGMKGINGSLRDDEVDDLNIEVK